MLAFIDYVVILELICLDFLVTAPLSWDLNLLYYGLRWKGFVMTPCEVPVCLGILIKPPNLEWRVDI